MKNRTRIGTIAVLLIFVILLSLTLSWLKYVLVLKRDDGITNIQNMYAQQEDSCDILLLGSSHVGMNLDCATLWEERGYASYALWGSVQPFWNSYYFLLEALKTQSPRLVVLDTFAAAYDVEFADEIRQLTNTVGMRMSLNKLNAIRVSAPPLRWPYLLLEYPIFHSRIEELTADDFNHFPWTKELKNFKGTDVRYGSSFKELTEMPDSNVFTAMHPKQEKYLRKIIELCADKKIELLLIKTPVTDRMDHKPYQNYVRTIADEYGVPFVDMNMLDAQTGLCSKDIYTDGNHLNTPGARKITSWLGSYIDENYDIPDHRGNPEYASWDIFSENMQEKYLKQIPSIADYVDELTRADYPVLLIQNCDGSDPALQHVLAELSCMGINLEHNQRAEPNVIFTPGLSNTDKLQEYRFQPDGSNDKELYFENIDTHVLISEIFNVKTQSRNFKISDKGIFLLVFNPVSKQCVDCVSLYCNNDYAMKHNSVK